MGGANKNPEVIIYAEPNGSGKSTLTKLLRPIEIPYVNADEIQRLYNCNNLEAAKIAEQRREAFIAQSQDFAFEIPRSIMHAKARKPVYLLNWIPCFYLFVKVIPGL